MRQWWPVAFLFALLAVLFCFIFFIALPRSDSGASGQPARSAADSQSAEGEEAELSAAEQAQLFAEAIEQRQPRYSYSKWECPVDGAELEVPQQAERNANNRFGGVATDLMAISLGPPEEGFGRPSLEKQDWEMLLVTCPECRATFHGIDLWQIQNGNYAIEGWNLTELIPQLAQRPVDDWTVEERILVRVLTQRAAGVEDVELGFSAIQGAYAANFGTWYGKEVHIPSAAFYALTAAYFKSAMESAGLTDEARSVTAQTVGEVYRLLGRAEDASAAFEAAREFPGVDPYRMEVLNQLEELLASGDYSLQIAQITEMTVPPGGWYLSEMLPAINSHIAYHREAWAGMNDSTQVIMEIVEQIP